MMKMKKIMIVVLGLVGSYVHSMDFMKKTVKKYVFFDIDITKNLMDESEIQQYNFNARSNIPRISGSMEYPFVIIHYPPLGFRNSRVSMLLDDDLKQQLQSDEFKTVKKELITAAIDSYPEGHRKGLLNALIDAELLKFPPGKSIDLDSPYIDDVDDSYYDDRAGEDRWEKYSKLGY